MDSLVSTWAFGFGGWVGVLGSAYLFVNSPQLTTFLTFLVSPWLGGIGMYILFYLTHCWITTTIQISNAMMQHELIAAVLTTLLCGTILFVFRTLIELDRQHRTQAEAAAAETVPESTEETNATDTSDAESGEEDGSEDEEDEDGEDADDEDSGESEETGDETEDETGESASGETSDSSLNKAHTDETSSYENIKTPQQAALAASTVSPVPKIPDI